METMKEGKVGEHSNLKSNPTYVLWKMEQEKGEHKKCIN